MTVYDSSVLIDYLDGDGDVVAYATAHADEPAHAPHLVLYEIYLGELHTEGAPDFDRVSDALQWVTPIQPGSAFGKRAAELLGRLQEGGSPLGFRDGYVAAAAWSTSERLVTRDADFDEAAVRDEIDVEVV